MWARTGRSKLVSTLVTKSMEQERDKLKRSWWMCGLNWLSSCPSWTFRWSAVDFIQKISVRKLCVDWANWFYKGIVLTKCLGQQFYTSLFSWFTYSFKFDPWAYTVKVEPITWRKAFAAVRNGEVGFTKASKFLCSQITPKRILTNMNWDAIGDGKLLSEECPAFSSERERTVMNYILTR